MNKYRSNSISIDKEMAGVILAMLRDSKCGPGLIAAIEESELDARSNHYSNLRFHTDAAGIDDNDFVALKGVLDDLLAREASHPRRIELIKTQVEIESWLKDKKVPSNAKLCQIMNNVKHDPEVRAEAEGLVKKWALEMARLARRKEHELPLPPRWKPSVKIRWTMGQRRSNGGMRSDDTTGISLNLYYRVPYDGRGGGTFREYARIAKHPAIGSVVTNDWRLLVKALVAHEVAHAIQYELLIRPLVGWHRNIDYRTAHGDGWQRIYALLRRELVNPLLKAERAELALSA